MAQTPFSALPALAPATPASGDELAIVDVSAGTLNNVTLAQIAANMPAITTPSVTGDVTGDVTGNLTGNVTGDVTGNVTGNVSGSSGSTTGNAATATALQTARAINGVAFDGTADITIPAGNPAAADLTGTTMASNVVTSSLTTVGALNAGSITSGFGAINIGTDPLTAGAGSLTSVALDDGSAVARINHSRVSLAANATLVLATGIVSASNGIVTVTLGNNYGVAIVSGAATNIATGASYTNTQGTSGKLNIYITSGSLTLENKTVSTLTGVVLLDIVL